MAKPPGRRRKIDEEEQYEESIKRAKTATDVQRIRLEKLLKNPEKLVAIPNPKKDWKPPQPPEFVRNVVGSSAGAGSGEYHIYRNLRKREKLREQYNAETTQKEALDRAYEERVEQKIKAAEEKTAKKRAKRLKKKQKQKGKQKQKTVESNSDDSDESDEHDLDESSKDEPPSDQFKDSEEIVEPNDEEVDSKKDELSQVSKLSVSF